MSDWKEDNYLEKLALPLGARSILELCPDAELLLSSTEQTGSANVSESVSQHLEHCPTCAEIRSRLLQFDQPENSAANPQTLDAEGRLDSWMKGFLTSQSLHPLIPSTRKSPNFLSYPATPKPRRSPKVLWTLAAAAALIMALGFVYFHRSTISPTPSVSTLSVDVARNSPSQERSEPQPSAPQPSAQLTPDSQSSAPSAPSKSLGHPANSTVASSIPSHAPSSSAPDPPVAPSQTPQTTAESTPSSLLAEAPVLPDNNPPPTGIPSVSPTTPSAPASLSRGPLAANSGTRSLHAFSGLSKTPSASTRPPASKPRPTSSLPPFVLLPAGTRLWITLQSPLSQIDGQFEFEGTLLLPVTVSGSLVLDKGIFIRGFGVTSGTQTSLTITTFKIRGSLYRLQIHPAAVGPPKLATGKVVQFQSGNVVELWLESSSTFEPVPGSITSPPQLP